MHGAAGFANQKPVEIKLFDYPLTVPSGHPLFGWYDPNSPRHEPYREAGFIKLAQALQYHTGTAIDIGANIGDTCAILHRYTTMKIISIDASDFFYPYLKKNVERCFADRATTRHAFVMASAKDTPKGLYHLAGSAKPIDAPPTETCEAISIGDLLASTPDVALLKVDIDGLDVELISGVFDAGAQPQFPIFFEYEFAGNTLGEIRAHAERFMDFLSKVASAGYAFAFLWDAPGRFYGLLDLQDRRSVTNALNYLGHFKHQSVWGYDTCLIHKSDVELASNLCKLISRETIIPLNVSRSL